MGAGQGQAGRSHTLCGAMRGQCQADGSNRIISRTRPQSANSLPAAMRACRGRACTKMDAGDRRPSAGGACDLPGRPSAPILAWSAPVVPPTSATMRSGRVPTCCCWTSATQARAQGAVCRPTVGSSEAPHQGDNCPGGQRPACLVSSFPSVAAGAGCTGCTPATEVLVTLPCCCSCMA